MAVTQPRPLAPEAGCTRELACDLFPGVATPFAWTLFQDPAETALRRVLTALGAIAVPSHALWQRQADGRICVASAALAAAGIAAHGAAWLGPDRPAAPSGPLARLQAASAIRRAQARVAAAITDVAVNHGRLTQWLVWVHQLAWSQADLLHVMEELEPRATAALYDYFTLRAGLAAAQAELQDRLHDAVAADADRLHGALFAGLEGLPTLEAGYALASAARAEPTAEAWQAALARFGHRGPGEMRPDAARWCEHPDLLGRLAGLTPLRTPEAVAAQRQAAEAEAAGKLRGRHRPLTDALRRARELARATDLAWDGLVMVMAAAQRWVQAAASEALAAHLIAEPADVLYLELEELKQIATGEWHSGDADQVQEAVAQRKAALRAGGAAAAGIDRPTPVYPGRARGPAYLGTPIAELPPPAAIWLAEAADPGCAPFWFAAGGIITAAADPWGPGLLAARGVGLPAVTGAGSVVASAQAGHTITLDGATGQIAMI